MSCIRCGACGKSLDECECPHEQTWLEQEYDAAEKAGSFGECPSCEDADPHVLCLVCGVCFKYCHPDTDHVEQFAPEER